MGHKIMSDLFNYAEAPLPPHTRGGKKANNIPSITAPLLLTTAQVGDLLNTSEANAKQLLLAHGVQPIDLGRGRGRGLRWRTSAVIQFADMLHTEAQAMQPRTRKAKAPFSVLGKSASELFAEFNGKNSIIAEVCDGN